MRNTLYNLNRKELTPGGRIARLSSGVCREGSGFSVPLGVPANRRMVAGTFERTSPNLSILLAIPVGMHGLPISECRGY